MAYILGFIYADGSIDINPRGSNYISIQICDKDLLYQIREKLDSNHKISVRYRVGNESDQFRLQIGSKEMCNDLRGFGLTEQKTFNLEFPDIPRKYLGDYVRGYFDGDGGVYMGDHLRKDTGKFRVVFKTGFTSGCKRFLVKLHLVLKQYTDIKGGFIIIKTGGFELVFSHHDSLALYQFMYNNASTSIFLKRKKDIFEKAFRKLGYTQR